MVIHDNISIYYQALTFLAIFKRSDDQIFIVRSGQSINPFHHGKSYKIYFMTIMYAVFGGHIKIDMV
jgi:hypothetical protein